MKEKLKNWWKIFCANNIVSMCPKHLDDLF